MKKIGILGGMSFESTLHYCEGLNDIVRKRLGGLGSARIALSTVNFSEIEPLQRAGQWDLLGDMLNKEAKQIEAAGADFLIIATNTMHKIAPAITNGLNIPLLHIADATAQEIKNDGIGKIGLLGTSYTMEQDFYKGRLEQAGLTVLVPPKKQRDSINEIIFNELCVGVLKKTSHEKFQNAIEDLKQNGAEGVILGCTEIGMLVKKASVPLYDTTAIHVKAAAAKALSRDS